MLHHSYKNTPTPRNFKSEINIQDSPLVENLKIHFDHIFKNCSSNSTSQFKLEAQQHPSCGIEI